jgi:enoyl-CoA hydratase
MDPYSAFPSLEFDRPAPHVLRLTLRAAGKLNAVSSTMHRELAGVWQTIGTDDETRAVIVRGADGAFSAGGDLDLVIDIASDYETRLRVFHEARDLVYNVVNCPKPIVSAMTGPAVGAGLAVGLLADISIATPNAKIVDGHTKLGVTAGDHAAIVWPLLCGLAKAKYHLLLCEPIDGAEAERIGLVLTARDPAHEARAEQLAARRRPRVRCIARARVPRHDGPRRARGRRRRAREAPAQLRLVQLGELDGEGLAHRHRVLAGLCELG